MTIMEQTQVKQVVPAVNDGGSSFMVVQGDVTFRTAATFSSTIRDFDANGVDGDEKTNIPEPITEEPPYTMTDDGFPELCATCLNKNGTRKKASHFCPGCDRRGRYLCNVCLKEHSVWCTGPEHLVQSLSVDRNSTSTGSGYMSMATGSEPEPPTLPQRNPPNPHGHAYVNSWLAGKTSDGDSDNGGYTASSVSDVPSGNFDRPVTCASSHIYCSADNFTMRQTPPPQTRGRLFSDPSNWEDMSVGNSTIVRLNQVYNDHRNTDPMDYLHPPDWTGDKVKGKKKKCVIQ